jgi:hypothetical protein
MKSIKFAAGLFLILVTIILFQCNRGPSKPRIGNDIYGSWAWDRSCGGYSGDCIYADSVDYLRTVYIEENLTYYETYDDSVVYDGLFALEDSITAESDTVRIIIIENYPSGPSPLRLIAGYVDTDSLILIEDCDDCYTHKYRRLLPI